MADGPFAPPPPAALARLRIAVEDVHLHALNAKLYVQRLVAAGLIHDEALVDTLATLEQCVRALDAVTARTHERHRMQVDAADFGGEA